ncbi:TPA: MucBP domain-containing protein [Streptococcus suis]|nr:MucBP domain-containing protein [Streptococcus suis]
MRKIKKKSFDWYGMKQHFSIRKYHFGAASVLLGMSLAVGAGAQTAQAETTTATTGATTLASSTEVDSSTTTEASATGATTTTASTEVATAERTATIEYTVEYQDESGKVVSSTVKSVETKTTDKIAIAIVTESAIVPEGYELVANEMATASTGVIEAGHSKVVFKVVKKAEEKAATSETTTTASTETATAKSTEDAATTTATVSEAVKTPATVEEAKTVLEQVTSEAEVLANESERLVAASDKENTALTAAAAATKLTATQATAVLKDSVATLDEVNAQINAVRTNVEALVLELRKYYPDGEITAVLDTATGTPAATTIETTNPASASYAQHGVWEIPDPVKAANSGLTAAEREATITVAEKNYPAGYIGDQDANRDTFLIIELDEKAGDGKGFNEWVGKNYYITFSVSTDAAERAANDVVYAKLVEKTDSGSTVVNTIELKPGVKNNFDELKVLENSADHRTIYGFTYKVSTANGGTIRQIAMDNSNGNNRNVIKYSKLEPSRVDAPFNQATFLVTGSTTQTTSYFVKENAATGRERELLAKYTQPGGLIGDAFHIAGAIDFDNYELIRSELPTVTSGTLASDYVVGSQWISYGARYNEARLYTITDEDGSLQIQVYMLDPNNPDWAKFYKTNQNNATVSDIPEYFKLMFTTEVLAPQAYNTKKGTTTLKFYEADKLVLESTEIQVLDANGDVLGTLSDDKSTITTTSGSTISVASTTDTMVTGTDGTIYTVNYNKIYKTDADGNYVDADGNVLTPILWDYSKPNNEYVPGIYQPGQSGVDNVTISTGPYSKTEYPNGVWYFGYNYKTAASETRLTDSETDKRWDLGGQELTLRNANTKNEQHVRYWYTEKGGVDVYYVDTEGKILKDMVTVVGHGDTGSEYNTAAVRDDSIVAADDTVYYYKEIDTTAKNLHPVVDDKTDTDYRSNEKIDAEKGTIKSDTVKQLTYVYEKAGNVNINYVDTEGNPLKAPVADVTNGQPGSDYNTAQEGEKPEIIKTKDGKTYKLAPANTYNVGTVSDDNNLTVVGNGKAKGIDDVTGTVESGVTKEITYVYKEVKGDVIVHYVDQDGKPISGTTDDGKQTESTVEDTPESSTGTPYNTTDLRPNTITTADGKIYKRVPAATIGKEDGKVVEGTTSITYVYEEVKGDVVVEYYDTEGNLISGLSDSGEAVDTKEVDTPSTSTGTAYNTDEDHKPNTITTADGTVYYYKEVKDTSASTTGKVVEGTTTVQYVYEKAGNVIVHYITEDGTVIKATVTDEENAKPGKSYDTTDNKPVEIVTEDGSRYVLIPSKTIGTENGTVEGGKTIEITYVYKKVANWIPQIPGVPAGEEPKVPYPFDPTNPDKPIDPTTPGTNGEVPSIPHVPGYTPVDPKTNEPLKPVDPTDPSKGYVPPTPDETGVDTPIPYVQNGNVVVNYVDENGNVIKAPVQDETNVPAGKSYDTTDNKPTEIVTEDGSRYVLIPSKTVGSETGTVEGGKTIEITYVYKKVANWIPQIPGVPAGEEPKVPYPFDPTNPDVPVTPTPDTVIPNVPGYTPVDPKTNEPLKPVDPTDPGKGYVPPTPDDSGVDTPVPYVQNGNVVVNYVTEDGTVIKTPVNDETDAPAGKSYDTTDNKPNTITTEDGTTYELVRVEGSETGTVVGGKTTEVTYVYRKVETPAKKVVTNHVDEDGNPIAPQEEGTTPNKSIPGYKFTGKTVTDPDGNTTHIYHKVVTNHVDEDGNPIAPQEEGTTPNKSIPGYEFTGKTVTDPDGNTTHIYRKVSKPVAPKPQAPVAPTTAKAGAAQLPNTGEASSSATVLGAGMLIAALALAGKRRRNED